MVERGCVLAKIASSSFMLDNTVGVNVSRYVIFRKANVRGTASPFGATVGVVVATNLLKFSRKLNPTAKGFNCNSEGQKFGSWQQSLSRRQTPVWHMPA